MRSFVSLFVLWGCILNTGCQSNSVDVGAPLEVTPSQTLETITQAQGDTQVTPSLPAPADPAASQLVDQARNDLAHKLGIPAEQITVSSAEAVTWSDSSLGCPQPGMAYTQVLTSGYLILLEAAGKTYEYHTNRDTYVIFCENPRPPVPGMPGDI